MVRKHSERISWETWEICVEFGKKAHKNGIKIMAQDVEFNKYLFMGFPTNKIVLQKQSGWLRGWAIAHETENN